MSSSGLFHDPFPDGASIRERIEAAAKESSNPLVQLCRAVDVRPDAHSDGDFHPDQVYPPKCMPSFRSAALTRLRELRDDPYTRQDAEVLVWIDNDRLQAWAAVLPPVNGGRPVSRARIQAALAAAGVRAGINTEAVDVLSDPKTGYMRLTRVARGIAATRGKDGKAIDLVTDPNAGEWLVDDRDKANYAERNWINVVRVDQKLGEIIPPTEGRNGYDVTGATLLGRPGRACTRAVGRNTHLSEDGRYILASVPGHFICSDGRFSVSEILRIPGNVDYKTGNIKFNGAVIIEGSVRPHFRVEAEGDIAIYGAVENGTIIGGQDVTIWGGVTSQSTGRIQAARDLKCKFMENARAYAGGNASFESLILCNVSCDGTIDVTRGKGVVLGGTLTAMGDIRVRTAGNDAFRSTNLKLAPTKAFLAQKSKFRSQLEATRSEWQALESSMRSLYEHKDNPKVAEVLARQAVRLNGIQDQIDELKLVLEDMQAVEDAVRRHRIYTDNAYPNVRLTIAGRSRIVRSLMFNAVFGLQKGAIRDMRGDT